MQYVICYDIADDRRRYRVAALLMDFGTRVQESVFVAHLEDELVERMKERLGRAVEAEQDKVHVFEVCAGCEKRQWTIGNSRIIEDPDWYVV